MEELNKNQIVLLTLLISFVTSIATGIMTFTLLQEAPVEVTRTINRIVEKTIETVTPATPTSSGKEVTTIIVKEEDSIVDSINKNVKSIVRIKERDPILDLTNFYGIGLVTTKDGVIVADRKTILSGNVYTATMNDGTELVLNPLGVDKNASVILFKAMVPEKTTYTFYPASFGDMEPKLGQTVIAIGGDSVNAISVGRISLFNMKDVTVGTTTTKYLSSFEADISSTDIVGGTPMLNLSGDIVGMSLSDSVKLFTPTSIIKKEIASLNEQPKDATASQ
ncbi:MAG: S1C family serine protease [Minisyncoccia bacterium]